MGSIRSFQEGPLGFLIFDNPQKRNAINYQMWQRIPEVLAEFGENPEIRVIIIRGAGQQSFTSGADLSEFKTMRKTSLSSTDYNLVTKRAYQSIKHCPKPIVALVYGFCMGGGLGIALQADLRIAANDAQFSISAVKRGIAYGYDGIRDLVDIIGVANAKEILFTARIYQAREALGMGLIHQLVPKENLEDYLRKYCLEIADAAPLSIKAIKIAINEYLEDPNLRNLDRVEEEMAICFDSLDYQEGYNAFLEKRKPKFVGR